MGLAACAPDVVLRGNLPDPDRIAEIHPGKTTKNDVISILGSPSTISVFDPNSWYYVSKRTKQVAFLDPDVLDQQVYIIRFNGDVVQAIGHKNLKDGELIEPAPGETPAPGRHLTFMEQFVGNIGRFNSSK